MSVASKNLSVKHFFIKLEELIKSFADDEKLKKKEDEVDGFSIDYISKLERSLIDNFTTNTNTKIHYGEENNEKLNIKFKEFMSALEKAEFEKKLIPYDKITECVFQKTPPEIVDDFTIELKKRAEGYFEVTYIDENDSKIENEEIFYRILRHINLAIVQKNSFMKMQLHEIDKVKSNYHLLKSDYEKLREDANEKYESLTTHFITILGIFAAILMGAFGAIESFSDLFSNAHTLSLGVLLIISSIGAASVLLILFFLLNSIAKLTEKSLASDKNSNSPLALRYPILTVSYGILIFISLIGAALELSNTEVILSHKLWWWMLPVLWLIVSVLWLIFSFNYLKNKSNE